MNEVKFGRILETGMGAIMSLVLSFSAQVLLGAPITIRGGSLWLGRSLCHCRRHQLSISCHELVHCHHQKYQKQVG